MYRPTKRSTNPPTTVKGDGRIELATGRFVREISIPIINRPARAIVGVSFRKYPETMVAIPMTVNMTAIKNGLFANPLVKNKSFPTSRITASAKTIFSAMFLLSPVSTQLLQQCTILSQDSLDRSGGDTLPRVSHRRRSDRASSIVVPPTKETPRTIIPLWYHKGRSTWFCVLAYLYYNKKTAKSQ